MKAIVGISAAFLLACGVGIVMLVLKLASPVIHDDPLSTKFVHLPKGTFYMGGSVGLAGKKTEIKEDFEIAVYTVTQDQWQALMGDNPSDFRRGGASAKAVEGISEDDLKQFPVENVSWDMVQDFIKKLNEREKGSGWMYRLPLEAEWEYACRGGGTSEEECSFDFYFDKPTNDASSHQANFDGGNKGRTTKVGSYQPNKLGLYDMHGNVWQWCEDLCEEGTARVIRGGCWRSIGWSCRVACRGSLTPADRAGGLGFRLARVPSGQAPTTPAKSPVRQGPAPALLTAPFTSQEAKDAQAAWAKHLGRKVEEEIGTPAARASVA